MLMTRRKERQKKGYLGHRSHGRGNVKNRRGSGNRGGRGMAGIDKHKWSWAMVNAPNYFGKYGFKRPHGAVRKRMPVIHLFDINQQALNNRLEKKEGRFHIDFKGKVLATGNVTVPLSVRAEAWSRNVEKKIMDAGGQIAKLEGARQAGSKPAPARQS
jgi:large subunit ribosomal protein L15